MGWKHGLETYQIAVTLRAAAPLVSRRPCFCAGNWNVETSTSFQFHGGAGNNQREVQKRATSKVEKCQFTVGNFVKLPDAVSPTIKAVSELVCGGG